MRHWRMAPIVALALVLASAGPLAAAGPDLVGQTFGVKVSGGVVDVAFALALSEVSTYPVTITAISGSTEEVLYEGTLPEGIYRFSAPLKKISGQGELRVILRTKVTSRSDSGSGSFLVYRRWQGSM